MTSTMSFGPMALTNAPATSLASSKRGPIEAAASTRMSHAVPTPVPGRRSRPSAPSTRTWRAMSVPSTVTVKIAFFSGKSNERVERAAAARARWRRSRGSRRPVSAAHVPVTSLMRLFCTTSSTVVSTGAPSTMLARGSIRRMCASGAAAGGRGPRSSAASEREQTRPRGRRCGAPAASAAGSLRRPRRAGQRPRCNVIVRSSGRRTCGRPASDGAARRRGLDGARPARLGPHGVPRRGSLGTRRASARSSAMPGPSSALSTGRRR